MPFSRLVLFKLATEIKPCLVHGDLHMLQAGFLLTYVPKIARGKHYMRFQLTRNQFTGDSFLYLVSAFSAFGL